MTRLDAIDLKILATLQSEGRITKAALAEAVNLSPTPCWERLKRLERSGLIRGYHAEIDLEKLGALATILVEIVLKQHRYEDFQRFESAIRKVDEMVECHATGGGIDYLLKVIAPDIDSLSAPDRPPAARRDRHRPLLHLHRDPHGQGERSAAGRPVRSPRAR